MQSKHRGILAIGLSVVVFLVWSHFFAPKPDPNANQNITTQETISESTQSPDVSKGLGVQEEQNQADKAVNQKDIPEKFNSIETDLFIADLSSYGAVLKGFNLKNYKRDIKDKNPIPVDLVSQGTNFFAPLNLEFLDASFDMPDEPKYEVISTNDHEIVYMWTSNAVEVVKKIQFSKDSYLFDVVVEIKNRSGETITERPFLSWSGANVVKKEKNGFLGFIKRTPDTFNKHPLYYLNGKVERQNNIAKLGKEEEFEGTLYWAGLEDRYFMGAVIPRDQTSQVAVKMGSKKIEDQNGSIIKSGAVLAKTSILPGERIVHKFSVYAGPKEINLLKAVGKEVRLDEAIDYGWFTIIATPMLYVLKFFYSLVRNYGVAIILLTVFIKLLLHPINKKSMKSMKAMQKLQPRLKELQKKHKGDRAKLNTETMQLFKAHKVNPMGGCLPMILQFPIYIALYKVLWNSIELYRAPFFWFYKDLSAPDPYLITPLLLGVVMFLQQRLMPSTSADPAQQKMMMIMPVMFTVFMLFLPVGLVLYILVNIGTSVAQQWMYNNNIGFREIIKGKFRPSKA